MVGTLPGDKKAGTAALPWWSRNLVFSKSDIALWDSTLRRRGQTTRSDAVGPAARRDMVRPTWL